MFDAASACDSRRVRMPTCALMHTAAHVPTAFCSPVLQMAGLASTGFMHNRFELESLKRNVLARHADEIESALGKATLTKAGNATTCAQFHEAVTMQVHFAPRRYWVLSTTWKLHLSYHLVLLGA